MTKLTFSLPTLVALVVYHTRTVSTDNATSTEADGDTGSTAEVLTTAETNVVGGGGLDSVAGLRESCPLRLPIQTTQVVLGCAGVVFNFMAVAVVGRDKQLSRSFRVVLLSLTTADLGFALTTVMAASLAIDAEFVTPQVSDCFFSQF